MKTESDDEWERSKENIQPIQQGRKQKVLKVALAPQPEDLIKEQRQAFEHELRTYTGSDILSVWCEYIKWVEQNFPKGGKEGQIKQIIERCLAILKDEKKYYDDERYVDILLKFANMSEKPVDVFNYMYSHGIGCKLAKLYQVWSWELEQLGNFKRANQVLTEGIRRQAEPLEKLKAYQKDFDVRIANSVREGTENQISESDSRRSAFAMLKPQKKKIAPIERTGEAVIESRNPLLLGRQKQPVMTKNSAPAKVPFKIYNSENIAPSLPVQSVTSVASTLSSENSKENELKAGKWNKVKVKPRPHSIRPPSESNLTFQFHRDEENADNPSIPRSLPKTSTVLSSRCRSPSPVMALFEPPDPTKKPMYPKNKVYGGAVEFSLEEIRAAELFQQKRMKSHELLVKEQEKLLRQRAEEKDKLERENEQMKKQIELLTKQMQQLKNNSSPSDTKLGVQSMPNGMHSQYPRVEGNKLNENSHPPYETVCALSEKQPESGYLRYSKHATESPNSLYSCNKIRTVNVEAAEFKTDTTTYREVDKMVQDLYNRSLFKSDDPTATISANFMRMMGVTDSKLYSSVEQNKLGTERNLPFEIYQEPAMTVSAKNYEEKSSLSALPSSNKLGTERNLPFEIYQEPAMTVSAKNYEEKSSLSALPISNHKASSKQFTTQSSAEVLDGKSSLTFENYQNPKPTLPHTNNLPFSVFCDTSAENENQLPHAPPPLDGVIPRVDPPQADSEENYIENDENVAPWGYVQEKNQRELAGILEPSKNVLFIPLEDQLNSQDEDIDDEVCHPPVHDINETLIPPSNTEHFSANLWISSTPCISRHNAKKPAFTKSENENVPSVPFKLPLIVDMPPPQSSIINQAMASSRDGSEKEHTAVSCLPKVLSTIMELSAENYSKSSTSSNSSSSLTKSGHLDPCSVRRPRLDTLGSIVEVPDSVFNCSHVEKSVQHVKEAGKDQELQLYTVDFDPFDSQETLKHLKSIDLDSYDNLYIVKKSVKSIKANQNLCDTNYRIHNPIAEGAYAKVYLASKLSIKSDLYDESFDNKVAIKVCKDSNEWEFFVCNEISKRLARLNQSPDVRKSFMNVTLAIRFTDGIALETEYSDRGTLLDVINYYKKQNTSMPEFIVMYLTLEILYIVSRLHELSIVHGDIKPDNFLLMNTAFSSDTISNLSYSTSTLRLIDFGRAIDLRQYKKGICFTTTLSSAQFQCPEMRDKKPWVFQLDWYGALSCIHALLFSEYMSIVKRNDKWGTEKKFKRYWCTTLWEPLFSELLNIPACYAEPNIKKFTDMIEAYLRQNYTNFSCELQRLVAGYTATRRG